MTTLVLRTVAGPLIQTQIGIADLIATFQAARAAYGWLGGLDPVCSLMNVIKRKSDHSPIKLQNLRLDQQLKLLPTRAHVLTGLGPEQLFIDNGAECFGADIRTQIIGLTVCALAHEIPGQSAVNIFIKHLAPRLFDSPQELLDALEVQLSDETTLQKILNEGASRGLTKSFIEEVSSSPIPAGDQEWMRSEIVNTGFDLNLTEVCLVGGLVKWISEECPGTYFTRSGLVARTAVYLRTVGYMIGRIESWAGNGNPPSDVGSNAVVVVLGGTHSTDEFMIPHGDFAAEFGNRYPSDMVHYYTFRTVGSLLLNSLGNYPDISPERLQDDFEYVHEYIRSNVKVQWLSSHQEKQRMYPDIKVRCEWQGTPHSSSTERSISGMYFPISGDLLAPCYRRIASEAVLKQARDSIARSGSVFEESPIEICRFRAVTACIVIGLASCLAPDTFTTVQHQTVLQLVESSWLDSICPEVDRFAGGEITLSSAVLQLAAIHAGRPLNPEKDEKESHRLVIGYRNGIFSVLPNLLLKMQPTLASISLACSDLFLANMVVSEDGKMNDTPSTNALTKDARPIPRESSSNSAVARLDDIWEGHPHHSAPDCPLYLSLERGPFGSSNGVALAGRIDGSVVGRASIRDILWVLIRSSQVAGTCNHTNSDALVYNMKPSRWAMEKRHSKTIGSQDVPLYLSVKGDNSWALFLAGETRFLNGLVVSRCVCCAKNLEKPPDMLFRIVPCLLETEVHTFLSWRT